MECSEGECSKNLSMPYNCKLCEQSFCTTHRLPENHDCPGLSDIESSSPEDWFKGTPAYTGTGRDDEQNRRVWLLIAILIAFLLAVVLLSQAAVPQV